MLRIVENTSLIGAKNYYTSARLADYYTQDQELTGIWRGKGAEMLGLVGTVERDPWEALCDNRNPASGQPLTPRRKADRRVCYDFNFHSCKSLSLLYGLTRNPRLLEGFQKAVNETMQEIEKAMQTRVRRNGKNEDRVTGNMVWGEFTHLTSRPVNGIPDPHLHLHVVVFNTTWDDQEQRWKAGQFGAIKADSPHYEAVFQSKLASAMTALGLCVVRTRSGWELAGLDKATLDKFSRRTELIEKIARVKGITNEDEKSGLGAKTREKKAKNLTLRELQEQWRSRLSDAERDGLQRITDRIGAEPIPQSPDAARAAVQLARDHCFERQSVVAEHTLLREALRRSYGSASRAAVEAELKLDPSLIRADLGGRSMVTTRQMLKEESAVVRFAREGLGTCDPLGGEQHAFNRDWLSEEQKRAVRQVLQSKDRVILLSGAAGVGKTTLLREVVAGIEANGRKVFAFAPSASASRGTLRAEGFADADTVARLLVDKQLQEKIRGQVLLVDEAGLLGIKTTNQLLHLADRWNARVILSGDARQHRSIQAGDTLGLLHQEAGLQPAQVAEIRRQKGQYRQAVKALSEGRTHDAFRQLDAMGAIKQVPSADRYLALADEYVRSVRRGDSTLVVSPTHAEGRKASDQIRQGLRDSGLLGRDERLHQVLVNLNLTEAERADAVNLRPGDVCIYHQNARTHKKGEWLVVGESTLPSNEAARYTVYRPEYLPISAGDQIRITKNGESQEGRRLHNGDICTVKGFGESGDLVLASGATLPRTAAHFTQGYVVTSFTSQSKTVDHVIVAESSASFPAASREQFYVSVSRGRKGVSIFTDDRDALLAAVSESDDRMTATELLSQRAHREQALRLLQPVESRRMVHKTREDLVYER